MSTWHYDETPLPVGLPVTMNSNAKAYELGLYDGANYGEQYADEPEEAVLFESPEGAQQWLKAVTAVLTPYIKTGDRSVRIPDATGWASDDETTATA
jgi:hypothetical protein